MIKADNEVGPYVFRRPDEDGSTLEVSLDDPEGILRLPAVMVQFDDFRHIVRQIRTYRIEAVIFFFF